MPHVKGEASTMEDLIDQVAAWATDSAIHGADAWELMRKESWPRGTVLKAHGWEEGEHQYIGMMFANIVKGESYKNWFSQPEVFAREFAYNRKGAGVTASTPSVIAGTSVTVIAASPNAQNITYTVASPEIFSASAQAVFFGVFKQYADGLNWDELPGGIRDSIAPLPLTYYVTGNENPQFFPAPAYPGVGFPAIGADSAGFIGGSAMFWVTKDRHRMTIVINNGGYWDAVHVGFLEPYHKPTDYTFPAVVVGGTSGVLPSQFVWYPKGAQCPSSMLGYVFDYTPANWSLSHGNAAFAAVPWTGSADWNDDASLSQVQLMLPDGTWQSFSNWAIQRQIITENACGFCPIYHYVNKEPEKPEGIRHFIRPTYSNLSKTKYIYRNHDFDHATYQLEPLELVQGRKLNTNMFGTIWRMYWVSSRIIRYGEQMISGKLHLIIPNGWEGRKFDIPHGISRITDNAALLHLQTRMEDISNTMNCVIRLED